MRAQDPAAASAGAARSPGPRRLLLLLGFLCVLAVLAFARPARAQEDGYDDEDYPENILKRHRFLTPTFVPSPFVSTNVLFQQGVLYGKIPDFPLTRRRSVDVEAVGIAERLTVGVRFLDRFQAFVLGEGQLLTGSNVKSIFTAGSSYTYALGGGAAARLFRSVATGTQLSLRAMFTTGPLGQLDLLALSNGIIAARVPAIENLYDFNIARNALASGTGTVLRTQLLAAQTLSPNFGLQAMFGFAWNWENVSLFNQRRGEDESTSARSFEPEVGVAFDATLLPKLPLAANVEWYFQPQRRFLGEAEGAQVTQFVHVLALGIAVEEPRFQVGLSIARLFGLDPIARTGAGNVRLESGTPWNLYGQFQMQYLW
jgi:hypothetical protein